MTKKTIGRIALLTAGLILAFAIFTSVSCTKARSQNVASAPAKRDPLEIEPQPALRQRLKVGEVPVETVSGSMEVPGRVETDEERVARISASLSGRVTNTLAVEGDTVKRGQVLATYFSTELAEQQSALLKANIQRQLADRAVSRARQLLAADVIGSAEVQRRESELQEANADAAAARSQLLVLGMHEDEIAEVEQTRTVNSIATITASMDGMVIERKVTVGQVVQLGEIAFVISDLSSVWLVADVPEQNSAGLHIGKMVRAEIAAYPGQTVNGKLSFVSAVVNRETRTVRARMELPNQHLRYKPAMLATMLLSDSGHPERILPVGAIVRDENKEFCFVETRPNTFDLREIKLGPEEGHGHLLLGGINPHARIVLDGAFHLNNERMRLQTAGAD